jgi:hypothetical protein
MTPTKTAWRRGDRVRGPHGRRIAHTVAHDGAHTNCGYPIADTWTPAAPSFRACIHCTVTRKVDATTDRDPDRDCLELNCAWCPDPIRPGQLFVGDNGAPKHHYTCPKDLDDQ